ncbi:hypothetical protein LCGC14_0728150 [marine sediment metagenome]|uniref:Uncharacterized protein n=1 Tax=marine sediment metagenome TaxID=412755 RepID=A0A0F9QVC9_9ZZZZ
MAKSYDRIKNYTTSISVEKTISELEKMLAKHDVTKIMKEYSGEGVPSTLVFAVKTAKGEIPIKLPCNVESILQVFKDQVKEGKLPRKYADQTGLNWATEQAGRVAWRIIKDWLDAQLTLFEIGMVKMEEIFLPYIYDPVQEMTVFQLMETGQLNIGNLLTEGGMR